MFVVRSEGGRVAAAYLDEQFPGQEWLPIDSGSLQAFLAAAPRSRRSPGLRRQHLGQIRR
ncbi:hypothetical protein [Reyranella soli]|jgi:hypothetical protein|uniref:Uncharacterized protein n=1 Tax=Reyranella soli TaxID=1230389 RepID=A0A512NI64_9HYPH|nr:hypothetical protein [Reyranella soli]GEP58612.1 hypothetical protein RSO01_57780 [Reyranella soli]